MKKMDRIQKVIIGIEAVLITALAVVGGSIGYANMDKDLTEELNKLPASIVNSYDGKITIVDYINKNVDGLYHISTHNIEVLSDCRSLAHELCGHYYYNEFMSDAQRDAWSDTYNNNGCTTYADTNSEEGFCEAVRLYTNSNPLLKTYLYVFYNAQYNFISDLF